MSDSGLTNDDLSNWIGSVLGEPVGAVRIEPLRSSDSASGVPLFRLVARSTAGEHRFVLKSASPDGDWIARATADSGVREVALFRAGLQDQLPPEIDWPAIDARPATAGGWLLLMRDLDAGPGVRLVPPGDDAVNEEEVAGHLVHLARLHRAFIGREKLLADVQLCDTSAWLTMLGFSTIERERGSNDPVTPHLAAGWDAFACLAPVPLVDRVAALLQDPKPLLDALSKGPRTLLHGDFKFGNLGWRAGPPPATVALDWSQAMWGPPLLDLAWFLAVNSARLPMAKEFAIAVYREAFGEFYGDWDRALDLALLGGGILRLGWAKALGATSDEPAVVARERAEIDWWLSAGERALGYLSET
ncbi:MAG: hypothetical protein QOG89_1369 [Thermomicrobiales bacterium]|nr:hypothetical protein [Thermomicrobiales bacterium]